MYVCMYVLPEDELIDMLAGKEKTDDLNMPLAIFKDSDGEHTYIHSYNILHTYIYTYTSEPAPFGGDDE
jgi:hypothetical protein